MTVGELCALLAQVPDSYDVECEALLDAYDYGGSMKAAYSDPVGITVSAYLGRGFVTIDAQDTQFKPGDAVTLPDLPPPPMKEITV